MTENCLGKVLKADKIPLKKFTALCIMEMNTHHIRSKGDNMLKRKIEADLIARKNNEKGVYGGYRSVCQYA